MKTGKRMWTYKQLLDAGIDLEPRNRTFTYGYPPARYVRTHGRPLSEVGGIESVCQGWPDVSLYLHIPYCLLNCKFCSLHRVIPRDTKSIEEYLSVLNAEVRLWGRLSGSANTVAVYIGGGTPSMLEAGQLQHLLDTVAGSFNCVDDVEVTVECAPASGRDRAQWREYLAALRSGALPVTRVSLGLQSWCSDTLSHMGRHGGKRAALDLLEAVEAEFNAYNVDFLFGYPTDSVGVVAEANIIASAVSSLRRDGFRLPSVSAYQLWDATSVPVSRTRHAKKILGKDVLSAKRAIQDALFAEGYKPSPAATFVHQGTKLHSWTLHRCVNFRHIGMGSGAYSFFPTAFAIRERDIAGYVKSRATPVMLSNAITAYSLSDVEAEIRRVILGLKSAAPVERPRRLDPEGVLEQLDGRLDALCELGLLLARNRTVQVAPDAFLLADEIAAYLHMDYIPRRQ